jgi:hypothetical protein
VVCDQTANQAAKPFNKREKEKKKITSSGAVGLQA